MLSRFIPTILIGIILSISLAGCSTATEQPPAEQPVSEAAAPTDAPAPTEAPATPIPATEAPPVAPTEAVVPTEAAAPTEAAPAATEAVAAAPTEAAEPSAELRTFQIVPDQSQASYKVQEEFFNRPVNIVNPVGSTNAIEGQFQLNINGNQVQLADNQFTVDLRTLSSDESRRDQRIRDQWLESNTYPWAEFKATSIEGFPADATEGQDVSFKLTGDMTVREITKPQTFDVTARLDGNTFTGTATSYLLMRDYGFEPPSILGMLEVTDGVTVTVNFVAQDLEAGS